MVELTALDFAVMAAYFGGDHGSGIVGRPWRT